jgi:oxygen-independent coproporphyrinogen-3 oxidase
MFIGGGTPSLLSGRAMARLLEGVRDRLAFGDDVEITLEANPGTADSSHFEGYLASGVNRLSIGIQSLDDRMLVRLGRVHDAGQAVEAVRSARETGFENVNLDLMFGLPGQTPHEALLDLQRVIDLSPEHISWYQLTLEPNTPFYRDRPVLPGDDEVAEMLEQGQALLKSSGYVQYEVSAYARAGKRCRHNLNYWNFGDYLGIGAGAHGKITGPGHAVRRLARLRHPKAYLEHAGHPEVITEQRSLNDADLVFEFMLNGLRLISGVRVEGFTRATGLPSQALEPGLRLATARGLLAVTQDVVCPTPLGRRFLDDLVALFLPEQ